MDVRTNNNDLMLKNTDEFQFNEHCKALDEATNELKKYLDKVLEMRLQCAELEVELATLYKPDLTKKIMTCQKTCNECKGLVFEELKDSSIKDYAYEVHHRASHDEKISTKMHLPESKNTSQ
ncbi:hypothetical protein J437_LFUL003162 [Ladona fulva]|uniref:Uncharacterized protein n=1 Tax=Ladona fulva TaxID=123851 RepID=A0A8K0KYT7_LADFU|nr:hypothetical protein J437_LFUL003162 [Ladona fulva]